MPINTASLGFEKKIWSSADKLRGNMDALEYKHVVLGLIFPKYISDSFETKYNELVEEGAGLNGERDNQRFKGTLPKNFARPELDKRRLREVVDIFTNMQLKDNKGK